MPKRCDNCAKKSTYLSTCDSCYKTLCSFCISYPSSTCTKCMKSIAQANLISDSTLKRDCLVQQLADLTIYSHNSQLEIECLSDRIYSLESSLKSKALLYMQTLNSIENDIQNAVADRVSYNAIDNLEEALKNQRLSEREKKKKFDEVNDFLEAEEKEVQSARLKESLLQKRIEQLRAENVATVTYKEIRLWMCMKCSDAVKRRFRQEILKGCDRWPSLVESVVRMKEEMSEESWVSQEKGGAQEAKEKCVCGIV